MFFSTKNKYNSIKTQVNRNLNDMRALQGKH